MEQNGPKTAANGQVLFFADSTRNRFFISATFSGIFAAGRWPDSILIQVVELPNIISRVPLGAPRAIPAAMVCGAKGARNQPS